MKEIISFTAILFLIIGCMRIGTKGKPYDYSNMDWMTKIIHKRIERFLNSCIEEKPLALSPYTRIDSKI